MAKAIAIASLWETADEIAPAIKQLWLAEDQILAYAIGTLQRESIAFWADHVISTTDNWPTDNSILLMQVLVMEQPVLTPYLRARLKDIGGRKLVQKTRVALVMPQSPYVMLARLFINNVQRSNQEQQQVFFDQQGALAWLLEWANHPVYEMA